MNPELTLNANSCAQRNYVAYDVADPGFIATTGLNANIYYSSFLNGRISKTSSRAFVTRAFITATC